MALKNRFERISRGEKALPLPFKPLSDGPEGSARFLHVSPERIERDIDQPRKDLGDLDGLRASIKTQGILQPLIVSPLDEDRFQLIAGERRLTAARQLGLAEVPVLVRGVEEHQRLVLQIVENLHRKDLSPLEEAQGFHRLMEESGLSQREVASRLGKSLTYINELLRILHLPEAILEGVRTSEHPITKSVLLEVVKEPNLERQRLLWQRVQVGGGFTVKQIRRAKRVTPSHPSTMLKEVSQGDLGSASTSHGEDSEAELDLPNASSWTTGTTVGAVFVHLHAGGPADPIKVRQALREALNAAGASSSPRAKRRRAG